MIALEEEGIFYYLGSDGADTISGDLTSAFTLAAESGTLGSAKINLGTGANVARVLSGHSGGWSIGTFDYTSASAVGALADRLTIEGVRAKSVLARMGAANSVVTLENAQISGYAVALGAGDDRLKIDDSLIVRLAANFFGPLAIDGSDGSDTFTRHPTNAVFPAGQPVLTSITATP